MNIPVSFELAKLLKEKGFDEPTLSVYQDEKLMWLMSMSTISNSQLTTSGDYAAPTIVEVVMWMYNKHGIWIYTYLLGIDYSCYIIQKIQKTNPKLPIIKSVKDSIVYNELFNSPTEAYKQAIEYCLTNLL